MANPPLRAAPCALACRGFRLRTPAGGRARTAGADYIGSSSDGVSNLTAPGTIYPGFKYGVWGAVATHPQGPAPSMLADGSHSLPPDHSGAFYCT